MWRASGRVARWVLPSLCLLALAAPVRAHETWLQPDAYVCKPGTSVRVQLRITDGKQVRDANLKPDRILRFQQIQHVQPGAAGAGNPALTPAPATTLTVESDESTAAQVVVAAGTSVLVMETEPKHIELPAAKFTAYLREQGLQAIVAERRKRGEANQPSREDFMRCMKALVVADGKVPDDAPQGCPYELVLRRLVSRTVTLQTLRHGDPEPFQQVRFWNLDSGKLAKTLRSDKDGRVTLPLPPGRWLATSTAMRRSSELQSDWRSDWASLTWQQPARR